MKKYVYMFSEGNASMRNLLGGKGANLAEMTILGLPIPQGFTITTEACTEYNEGGKKLTDEMIGHSPEPGSERYFRRRSGKKNWQPQICL